MTLAGKPTGPDEGEPGRQPQEPHAHPEHASDRQDQIGHTRRGVVKAIGGIGLFTIASNISEGIIPQIWEIPGAVQELIRRLKETPEQRAKRQKEEQQKESDKEKKNEADELVRNKLKEAEKEIREQLGEHASPEMVINYLGVGVFAWGIKTLISEKPINQAQFSALGALLGAKYAVTDEQGKEKLVEEMESGVKTTVTVAGMIVSSEGMKIHIDDIYKKFKNKAPSSRDKVAFLTAFSGLTSPAATTIGASGMGKELANDIAAGDKNIMHTIVGHVGVRSGYLLFGNPPFLATVKRFGLKEGIGWQLRKMWPLYLYSWASSSYKINLKLAEKEFLKTGTKEALKSKEVQKQLERKAKQDSWEGMKENFPLVLKVIAHSLVNFLKYFGGIVGETEQNTKGMTFEIGEKFVERFLNLATGDAFWATVGSDKKEITDKDWEKSVDEFVKNIGEKVASNPRPSTEGDPLLAVREKLMKGDKDNLKAVRASMEAMGVHGSAQVMMDIMEKRQAISNPDKGMSRRGFLSKLTRPLRNATDIDRLKEAVGDSCGDVLNVMSYQIACIPFLTPVFKEKMEQINTKIDQSPNVPESMKGVVKELAAFGVIFAFSTVADNYVAQDIGFQLVPEEKAHVAAIAAYEGGAYTAMGNMSNMVLFDLHTFPLIDTVKTYYNGVDNALVALAWSFVLSSGITDLFLGGTPKPKKAH